MMSATRAIASREFKSYFGMPAAYAVLTVFLAVTGYLFTLSLFTTREANLQYVFGSVGIVLLFLIPALTMRLMADEKKSGTLDVLLACPVRDWEIILGKYLGSLAFYGVMLVTTLHYPALLALFGRPDYVPMGVGYLGVFLLGGAVLATGLWTSTLTRSQIVAYVSAFGLLLLLWSLGSVGAYLGGFSTRLFNFVSLTGHYEDFTRGILDSRHVVYYLTWIFLFLALSVRSLGLRRWL
jgi:ABC-2 type transport system permease protein